MRRLCVAGNWKMNGSADSIDGLLAGIKQGAGDLQTVDLVVFPPFVYLDQVRRSLTGTQIAWGAQTLAEPPSGAFTGEVSASMLLDVGCTYVLVGHSERRTLYGETDVIVAGKFAAARSAGLQPVLCVGESLEEREQGITEAIIDRQLDAVLESEGIGSLKQAIIAYEPVWAIGTGKTASPAQAQEVHAFIRGKLAGHDATIAADLRILYGGSVKGSNAAELFAMADIDGGLVGGASLDAAEFLRIATAAGL